MSDSVQSELNHTLEDDAWKDSFDKLLDVERCRPVLRELKILKKDVRAAFNIDSSVENSKVDENYLDISGRVLKRANIISTPVGKLPKQPFNCAISPISNWLLDSSETNKKSESLDKPRKLQSTVVHNVKIVVDYDEEKEKTAEQPSKKDDTLEILLAKAKKFEEAKRTRQVVFNSNIIEHSKSTITVKTQNKPKRIVKSLEKRASRKRSSQEKNARKSDKDPKLQPGKWRKSFIVLKRSQQLLLQTRRSSQHLDCQLESIVDKSVEYVGTTTGGVRKTILIKPELINESQPSFVITRDFKERVLQYCKQEKPLPFKEVYGASQMRDCYKIGEGVYGEVFIKKEHDELIVCKIIPIEGTLEVNGEVQKTFEQILPEIVISQELCNLRDVSKNSRNITNGFIDMKKVALVQGKYPQHLLECWKAYDEKKSSENDPPDEFSSEQLFVVLELEFGGHDLETFVFNNAEQSFAALEQVVFTLAAAEEALQFEHRDLHWGNVLVRHTEECEFTFKIAGEAFNVKTHGVRATIIDYTLSRITQDNHCFYNDLAHDEELFTAKGDYQFDIYRMMRDVLVKNWERFEPKTNIFWISYIISKMVHGVSYKNARSKAHTQCLRKMRSLKNEVLDFNSAWHFAKHIKSLSE